MMLILPTLACGIRRLVSGSWLNTANSGPTNCYKYMHSHVKEQINIANCYDHYGIQFLINTNT